jgi:hypothetical protein
MRLQPIQHLTSESPELHSQYTPGKTFFAELAPVIRSHQESDLGVDDKGKDGEEPVPRKRIGNRAVLDDSPEVLVCKALVETIFVARYPPGVKGVSCSCMYWIIR